MKFTIEYKGTNYCGWQIQKNQSTIQGELKNAFRNRAKKVKTSYKQTPCS